jgi:hypothetical protein
VKVGAGLSNPARGRKATALAVAIVTLALALPAPAYAITRDEVIARASSWVARHVGYSRRAKLEGYRRDCSGMVSMAWKLKASYTSRSISSRARRIPVSLLQPGDAVLTPGHVAIFGGWADRSARTYVALEQSGRRRGAVRRVRSLGRRAVGLQRRGIVETPVLVAAAPPAPAPATPPAPADTPPLAAVSANITVTP